MATEVTYNPNPREGTPEASLSLGGGAQQVFDANVTPDDPTLPAIYYDTSTGNLYQWKVSTQAWT